MKTKTLLLVTLATLGLTVSTMAQNLPNYVPANGLVGWWPFNGNANDESGNENNGSVNGATLTSNRFGNASKAYDFDGINDFISVLDHPTIKPANISISTWVLVASIQSSSFNRIISKQHNEAQNFASYQIITGSSDVSGKTGMTIRTGAGNSQLSTGVYNWSGPFGQSITNQWQHVVGVYDGNNLKYYQNGVLISTIPHSGALFYNNENLFFGKGVSGGSAPGSSIFYSGKIDDIGIWNRALTQQEIIDLYTAVDCSNNTNINQQVNTLLAGSTATFTSSTSDTNPSYAWQSDFGQGFQTLNNFGNYSGTNTATLNIANIQLSEHNQPIRVITTSGNCIDTSNVAIITIADTCINTVNDTTLISVTDTLIVNTNITALNPPNNSNTIKVFPNPTNDHITIDYGNFSIMNGYQLQIENSLGQQVFQTEITQQSDYLNLSTWGGNGLYFVHIIDPEGNTIDIRKIVLQ